MIGFSDISGNSIYGERETQPSNYCNLVKKVKKDNITPGNIGEIILSQIPGVSSVTAIAIMSKFTSFYNLIESLQKNPGCLEKPNNNKKMIKHVKLARKYWRTLRDFYYLFHVHKTNHCIYRPIIQFPIRY